MTGSLHVWSLLGACGGNRGTGPSDDHYINKLDARTVRPGGVRQRGHGGADDHGNGGRMHRRHGYLLAALVASCGFHPSSATSDEDAATTEAPIDASSVDTQVDAHETNDVACAAAGGTYEDTTCTIDVTDPGPVGCPPGLTCDINCKGDGTCNAGVDCSLSVCTIQCRGDHSCSGDQIECSANGCELDCLGKHSCSGSNIACLGGTCTYECGPGGGCGDTSCINTICSGGGTCTQGNDCP
ncbi:MAG: hypothetical protein ABI548_08415 [Polyangiaceae bacterium]